ASVSHLLMSPILTLFPPQKVTRLSQFNPAGSSKFLTVGGGLASMDLKPGPFRPVGDYREAAEFRRQMGNPSQTANRTASDTAPATEALFMLSVTLKKTTAMSPAMPIAKGMEAAMTSADPILKKLASSSPWKAIRCSAAGVINRRTESATAQRAAA